MDPNNQHAGDVTMEAEENAASGPSIPVDADQHKTAVQATSNNDARPVGEGKIDGVEVESGNGSSASTNLLDEASALEGLAADVRDQDDLERDITHQASLAFIDAEDKRDEKRIEKAQNNVAKLEAQKKTQEERFRKAIGRPETKQKIREEIARIDAELDLTRNDITQFEKRIEKRHQESHTVDKAVTGGGRLPGETHREFLIRTGKITPFDIKARAQGVEGELADALADAEEEAEADELEERNAYEPRSHQNLRAPGFAEDAEVATAATAAAESEFSLRPRKRQRNARDDGSSDEYSPPIAEAPEATYSESQESEDYDLTERLTKKAKKTSKEDAKIDLSNLDDGIEANYQTRLTNWVDRRSRARLRRQQATQADEPEAAEEQLEGQEEHEWFKPSPDEPDHHLKHGLKLPGDVYPALFDYQKTGVQWLAELYSQQVGGIVGDEMGLGKTVQIISFIAALHYSKKLDKPVLVVAPATVLQQWVNEFHRWWPPLRVSMLHSSGSGMLNMSRENELEDEDRRWDKRDGPQIVNKAAKRVIDRVAKHGHVLVTTYASVQVYGEVLATMDWGYAVLDEGHKIRNPNAAVTIACKELCTPNRVILSGTPIQNNLVELWSLFDFIYPMRLGTLVDFRREIEIPIKIGGYANASHLQIMTAEKTAQALKDNISPYLLQRLKVDVAADLPKKREQVLFCKLTQLQYETYRLFLDSKEMGDVLKGTTQSFFGIDRLRKICNHPDLADPNLKSRHPETWGAPSKSGKMQVLKALLGMWKKLGHKTLLFSQTVQMLDILEKFVRGLDNVNYLRMDGKTPIKMRQVLVDQFNKNPQIDLFLLTTKVGGLGVNLTGANRVIIYDPDWNPSTDVQARERAWRLGQKKEVTIYRLMTAGTIEEKIYHRQIYKQFLSNKVLKDPKHRTTFNLNDLHNLFTLGSSEETGTETARLFKGSEVDIHKAGLSSTTADAAGINSAGGVQNTSSDGHENTGLQDINGVASLEEYDAGDEAKATTKEEDRIMEGLFARSGVQSAHEHDAIVGGKQKPRADRAILQQEAARVAAEAASVLRRAQEQARHIPIGTVTWTGEVGEGGRPSNIRRGRGGPSGTSVLSNLSERQGRSSPSGSGPASQRPGGRPTMGLADFVKAIPTFIRRHGGRVPTKVIVDHFNPQCKTRDQTTAFKEALNRVAKMDSRGSSMRGIWVLRDGS
ncbi:putative DNA repair and recombination protein RAD26 [Astrocystis sublimbata]|nr:putative DNA repair and recombination protein RAD26 [Astrocystis sublimbata]